MKHIKLFEQFDDYEIDDIFGKDKKFEDYELYLSEDQPMKYDDGTPLKSPWVGKNLALLKKNTRYYILGEIRYTRDPQFFMFYANKNVEGGNLKEFGGGVSRKLNIKEKDQVTDILTKTRIFTRNLMDPENGKRYIDKLKGF